jgi:hypothetical protein
MSTVTCPDCGSSQLTLREAESTWNSQWYQCPNGHKFCHKTLGAKLTERAPLVIAACAVARILGVDIDLSDHLS